MEEKKTYRRVLLKLSGECFGAPGRTGVSMAEAVKTAQEVKRAAETGVELAVVIGGGNILRGNNFKNEPAIQDATAHYMGMLSTVINGLAAQDALESVGCETRLMSAIKMDGVCEMYIRRRADRHLRKGRIIILAAGTGGPYVTTDTAAALRSLELNADVLMKATKVDGVYSDDPHKNDHAVMYPELDYATIMDKNLGFMDKTAIAHCMENEMPIRVFNYQKEGNIERAVSGENVGTIITSKMPAV